jgi:hypothetical protein
LYLYMMLSCSWQSLCGQCQGSLWLCRLPIRGNCVWKSFPGCQSHNGDICSIGRYERLPRLCSTGVRA